MKTKGSATEQEALQKPDGGDGKQEAENSQHAEAASATAQAPEAAGAEESVQQLRQQLEETRQQAQDHYDRLLRVSAELDNFKKRTSRQMDELRKFATEQLLKDLLAVVDNLERALDAARQAQADKALVEGIQMTLDEMHRFLGRQHVQGIEAVGQPFDPSVHQAMMQEETDAHPPNTVIGEMQKGYMIHDRLLRPALVVVAKPPADQPPEQGTDTGGEQGNKDG